MNIAEEPPRAEAPSAPHHRRLAFAHAFWENPHKPIMATPAHPRRTLEDGELARLASAGDGHAFAELYDRHERRVYGFCVRMLGSPHDAADATQETFVRMLARLPALEGRELNFAAYALAAARNACYDMIEGKRKVQPVAEQPEAPRPQDGDLERDPERAALLATARADVQAANAQLAPRQREALALREVELLSYDEIGELMGLNRNAVAQLISRARIALRDLLRGSALASVNASSPECSRALPLLAGLQDGEQSAAEELEWARAHLSRCETCRLGKAAMEEAGVSYRALVPIVPLVWLRQATIARAAESLGYDWSGVAGSAPHASADGYGGDGSGGAGSGGGSDGARGDGESGGSPSSDEGAAVDGGAPAARSRRKRRALASGALAALLALGVLLAAMVGVVGDARLARRASVTPAAQQTTLPQTATDVPSPRHPHRTVGATYAKRGRALGVPHSAHATFSSVPVVQAGHRTTRHSHRPLHRAPSHPVRHKAPPAHRQPPKVTPPPPVQTTPTTPPPPVQTTPTAPPTQTTQTTKTPPPPPKEPPPTGTTPGRPPPESGPPGLVP
jgi:RNA polymerase sigma-70 factor (ECF subfamily)